MKKIALLVLAFFIAFFPVYQAESEENPNYYYIEISLSQCRLWLYKIKNEGEKELKEEYIVSTVKKGLIHPFGQGEITKIEFNPWWYPTEQSRDEFKKSGIYLSDAIPPGHKNNYMGDFKMHLSHKTSRGLIYRIHGNNDETKIGKRVTGGCIRMKNDEGVALAKILPLGTKVNIIN